MKRVLLWGIVIGLTIGSVIVMVRLNVIPSAEPLVLISKFDKPPQNLGAEGASTTLVVFSDFQCPACARHHASLQKLREELGDTIQLSFRHFPLDTHTHAFLAALYAEAAGRQGKFWEMHDLLYEDQKEWENQQIGEIERTFTDYALSLGLNAEQLRTDLDDPELTEKVRQDKQGGKESGVKRTPTFFLNGKQISKPPRNYEDLKKLIEQERPS